MTQYTSSGRVGKKRVEIYLPLRAARAADKITRWPRRFILFGPRMVPLETFLLSEAKTHHSMQKIINRLEGTIGRYKAMVARRERSLQKAHVYIQDLKQNGAEHPRGSPPPRQVINAKGSGE